MRAHALLMASMILNSWMPLNAQTIPAPNPLADMDSVFVAVSLQIPWTDTRLDSATVEQRLRTQIELTLRRNGMLVSSTSSLPRLALFVNTLSPYAGAVSFSTDLELDRPAFLAIQMSHMVFSDSANQKAEWIIKHVPDSTRQAEKYFSWQWQTFWSKYENTVYSDATVWKAGSLHRGSTSDFDDKLKEAVGDLTDAFVNSYLAANPTKQ